MCESCQWCKLLLVAWTVAVAASEIASVIPRHLRRVQARQLNHWLVVCCWVIRPVKPRMSTPRSLICSTVCLVLWAEVIVHWQHYSLALDICTLCPEKRNRQYFGRNFDKFRQLLIIFSRNHSDSPCDWKIEKCPINTCMTLRNDDIIVTSLKNAIFARREMPEFILPLLWPPNSLNINPVD